MNLPAGSMAKPRGCFSVGVLADEGELAGRAIDAEAADRARGALGRIEELAVRRQVQVRRPDVVRGVARRLVAPGAPTAPRGAPGPSLVSGGSAEAELELLQRAGLPSSASVVTVAVSSFSR